MPAPTFIHTGGTVTFTRAPGRPTGSIEILQSLKQAAGSKQFGFDSYDTEKVLILRWPRMTTVNLAALETFMTSTTNGMADTFTYNDVFGAAKTVRFATPKIESSERASGSHEVTIYLLEV